MSDWYKMNPVDWNSGTDSLTLEQEAAYLRICNAMYISNGPISANHFVLCGLFRCNDRKAKRLLSELVEAGKLSVENGFISNRRAVEEISNRSRIEIERRSAGIRGGVESGKTRSKQLENNNPSQAIASTQNEPDKIREDKNRYISSSLRSEDAHTAIDAYKKMARETGLAEIRSVSEGRKQAIKKRISEHGLPVVLEAIDRVGRSSFCHGDNDRGWKADFDFICQPSSFLSIIEGKYDNRVVKMQPRERGLFEVARDRARQERENLNERIIDATANPF